MVVETKRDGSHAGNGTVAVAIVLAAEVLTAAMIEALAGSNSDTVVYVNREYRPEYHIYSPSHARDIRNESLNIS